MPKNGPCRDGADAPPADREEGNPERRSRGGAEPPLGNGKGASDAERIAELETRVEELEAELARSEAIRADLVDRYERLLADQRRAREARDGSAAGDEADGVTGASGAPATPPRGRTVRGLAGRARSIGRDVRSAARELYGVVRLVVRSLRRRR